MQKPQTNKFQWPNPMNTYFLLTWWTAVDRSPTPWLRHLEHAAPRAVIAGTEKAQRCPTLTHFELGTTHHFCSQSLGKN